MLTRRSIAAVVTALGSLAGVAAWAVGTDEPLRLAQATDVRQEDRQADRQEDLRADRQMNPEMKPVENPAEVRVPLPRNPNGTIDIPALLNSITARVRDGAREIQIRNDSLTQEEARLLPLATNPNQNLLARIGAVLPNDGRERNVTFRGIVDARVQREPDGTLRLIVRDIDIGSLTAAQRAQLVMDLSRITGFDRVRIRGVDADGNRIRVEFRADKGLTRNEARADARDRREDRREGREGRDARVERTARVERAERAERVEKPERVERPDRSGPSERVERVERPESGNSGRR